MINIQILNNTIITPDTVATGGISVGAADNFVGIMLNNYFGANSGNVIKNNIVVSRNPRNFALFNTTSEANPFSTYDMSNNLWYTVGSATPIHWGPDTNSTYTYTIAQWKALAGSTHGLGDISSDPLFAGGANIFAPSYYFPTSPSPTRGAAVTLSGFVNDYSGVTRSVPWTIGALELVGAPQAPKNLRILP
jgi:hypothetical protein